MPFNFDYKVVSFKISSLWILFILEWTDKDKEEIELPIFEFSTIANATDNFSSNNKLGQGGFGHVYKVMKQYAVSYLL